MSASPDAFTSDAGAMDSATPSADSGPQRDAGPERDAGSRLAYLPAETFEADTFPGYVVHDPARDRDIDLDRIAIVGHSGGALTTMALAGARIDYSPSVRGVDMSVSTPPCTCPRPTST